MFYFFVDASIQLDPFDSSHPPYPPTGVSHADSPSRRSSVPPVGFGSTIFEIPSKRVAPDTMPGYDPCSGANSRTR